MNPVTLSVVSAALSGIAEEMGTVLVRSSLSANPRLDIHVVNHEVESDPMLLRLYPNPEDLGAARRHLSLFLAQYWGGPTTYSDERGHPRLRLRHAPFAIGPGERDHWLRHMRAAVASLDPEPDVRRALEDYFETAAESMRNRF